MTGDPRSAVTHFPFFAALGFLIRPLPRRNGSGSHPRFAKAALSLD
jgi:hypothetical protein